MEDNSQSIKVLWQSIKRLISLNVDNAKLTLVEKLALFSTAAAFYFVVLLLGVIIVFFVSMSICHLLLQVMEPQYVYLVMAAFYMILLVIVCAMKNVLFLNPISRFVSKLLLNPPQKNAE